MNRFSFGCLLLLVFSLALIFSCDKGEVVGGYYQREVIYEKWDSETKTGADMIFPRNLSQYQDQKTNLGEDFFYYKVYYNAEDVVIKVEAYKNGNPHGFWSYYSGEGELTRIEFYENGELKQVKSYIN